jgi:DNA-binding NarL/FixJ family response regulator
MSIRVLIADDHPVVRDGLRFSLERTGRDVEIAGEASDGIEVLEMAQSRRLDVFILDITMPRLNGLDTARALIKRRSGARIIILSLHASHAMINEAFDIGALGYLTKETASRNVAKAVHEVYAGHLYVSPDVAHVAMARSGWNKGRRGGIGRVQVLTPRERRVLQLIAEGRSAKEVAAVLGCTIDTVRTHRRNLMAKLGLHKEADLVHYAIKAGIAKL